MTCIICQYGETELGTTTVALTRAETTIVIRDVPAQICTTCGGSGQPQTDMVK